MSQPSESEKQFEVLKVNRSEHILVDDSLAVEEPMEIRVVFGPAEKRTGRSLSITMRTPDHDFELAAGFLFTEGIISNRNQIKDIEFCGEIADGRLSPNIVRVHLSDGEIIETQNLQRNFYTTSSCGVCGKSSMEALENQNIVPIESDFELTASAIYELPNRLRHAQDVFDKTGGLHASGLFDRNGQAVCIREDVGRHNAVDKIIGQQFFSGNLPLSNNVLVVSGRASFELMQKSISAGIPIMVAVGAPSSLAVELANRFNATLIGFTSDERFNVYAGRHRIIF